MGKGGETTWRMRFDRLRDKYRLVVTNAETFQEVWGMRLSRLNLLVSLGIFFLLVLALSWVLIVFTPMREFIPGYTNTSITQQVVGNALRADTLDREMALWSDYLDNLRVIFSGGSPEAYLPNTDSIVNSQAVHFSRSEEDSLLRVRVEKNMQLGAGSWQRNDQEGFRLFAPLHGTVSSRFDPSQQHFGVDIVTDANAPISAVADGTVLMTSYDTEYGFLIMVQHSNGLVTIYKHCKEILRREGARLKAGDGIAIVGNSGRLTTGPHLHFEMWFEGQVLNPENYIVF